MPENARPSANRTPRIKRHAVVRGPILAAILAALAGLAAALAVGTSSAAVTRQSDSSLSGAGSSFVFPLVSQWINEFKDTQVKYNPIGSGGGIAAITSRTVDFGASDAPLSKDQFGACKGCVQIPWALSATSIAYNLPGLNGTVHLSPKVLAEIYLGKITQWNDSKLKKLNPKLNLPSTKIIPVYRSDNSGTTYNFTDFLSSASSEWKSKIGVGVNANWPTGRGAKGSSGVAGVVSQTEGAVSYVDVAYSLKNHLKFAAIQNRAGKYTLPGLRSISAAASTVKTVTGSNELSIVNPPRSQRLAYPICTFTYVIVPLQTDKAPQIRKFVFWALTKGQAFGPKLLFQPVPKPVLVAAEKTLKKIHS